MKNAGNDVHIVFAVDKNYAPFVIPVMHQLHKFDTKCDSIQIVVAEDVENSSRDLLISKGKEFGFEVKVVETNILNKLREKKIVKDRTHVSYFTYVKLFLPELLPSLDQVLYLDVDILIREPINDLLNWKLKSPVGAVIELGRNGKMLFNSNRQHYFNAGVLRMSLHKCREIALMEKAEEILIEKGGSFEFQDQDVLNIILKNRIDPLPNTFNVFHDNISISPKLDILNNPAIVHFNGPDKPWKDEVKNNFAQEWRSHLVNSGGNLSVLGITSSPEKSRIDFAAIISEIRFSPLGTKLRQSLPYFIKKSINSIIYWLYKISRRNNQVFLDALFSDAPMPAAEDGIEIPDRELVPTNDSGTLKQESTTKNLPQPIKNIENRNTDDRLIFVVSQARSGSNAIMEYISKLNVTLINAGELFIGTNHAPEISRIAGERYASLKAFDWEGKKKEFKDWPDVIRAHKEHQEITDSKASHLLDELLADIPNSKNIFVVKMFPDQLSTKKFNEILYTYKPRVIVLKRRMVFSFISALKARISKSFTHGDNSSIQISLEEKEVKNYINRTDEWFSNVESGIVELGLQSLIISYEGFFDSGVDVRNVSEFINKRVEVDFSLDASVIKLPIQDRRSDNSLAEVFSQFAEFPRDLQKEFVRYPGNDNSKIERRGEVGFHSKDQPTPVHFLHINKCAGSEIGRYAQFINENNSNYTVKTHGHDVNLKSLPQNELYFFSIRDPITRFVSAFYSRKRKGRPRYDSEWSEDEAIAFSNFDQANFLAESLYKLGSAGEKAVTAMKSIGGANVKQIDWFANQEDFLNLRPPVHIIRQEHFDNDLSVLFRKLGIENNFGLKRDPVLSHENNYEGTPPLSELAIANLKIWYAQDIEFYKMCSDWIEKHSS